MAAVAQDFSSTPATAKTSVPHPLCPLTAAEISTTADLLRSVWPSTVDLRFKVITLDEPAKKSMVPYLEAEHSGAPLPPIPRKSFVSYYIRNTVSKVPSLFLGTTGGPVDLPDAHTHSLFLPLIGSFPRGRRQSDSRQSREQCPTGSQHARQWRLRRDSPGREKRPRR